ncbi:MAG: hypothetical protein IK139_09265 [Lachnospiraceae bacterium]|nr:hypothetical protein [Lachnospiraceae bacterium]
MNRKETITAACLTVFVACLPLFCVNCIGGHDIIYHLLRVESLKTGLENGLPFLRVNMLFFNGQGYASSLFYPDLFLYIPALLRFFGLGINASYHIFIAFCLAAGFASAFYCMYTIGKNSACSLIFAVMFTLFGYHLYDVYERGAAGEFTALIFVPFVLAGLYDLMCSDYGKPYLLVIGMSGVILTHTITAVMCALLCAVIFITGIGGIIKDRKKMGRLLLSVAAVILITAFYVFPMMEMLFSTQFSLSAASFDPDHEKLLLKEVFSFSQPSMGPLIFLPLLLRIFIRRQKEEKLLKFADICMIFGLAACLCTTGFLPWKKLESILYQVQFPWRLFVIAAPLVVFADAVYIARIIKDGIIKEKTAVFTVLCIMFLSALWSFENTGEEYYSYSDDYFDYPPYTAEVIGGEWLPASAEDRDLLVEDADRAFDDAGRSQAVTRTKNSLTVTGIAPDSKYIDVPFVYYKGYTAKDAGGRSLAVDGSGRNGQARVYTEGSGSVLVTYSGTLIQHISSAVSLITLICIAAAMFFAARKKKKS